MCEADGKITGASVVDHITPHKGDMGLFLDPKNLQSMCKHCHDSTAQRVEKGGDYRRIGINGWPVEAPNDIREMLAKKRAGRVL